MEDALPLLGGGLLRGKGRRALDLLTAQLPALEYFFILDRCHEGRRIDYATKVGRKEGLIN